MMQLIRLGKPVVSRSILSPVAATFASGAKFDCDNCAKKLEEPECKACDRMVNYFKVFSIPEGYKVDPTVIKAMARNLQKEFHPDRCGDESQLKDKMQEYSSYINEAKATLLNDLQRAVYLMTLRGVDVQGEEIESGGGQFMEEMFELQEEIEEAGLAEARGLEVRVEGVLREVNKELELFFTSEDLVKCKEFVVKYKYVSRALANVKARIAALQEASCP